MRVVIPTPHLRIPLLLLLAALGACGTGADQDPSIDAEALDSVADHPAKSVCDEAQPGFARCHALVRTDLVARADKGQNPAGLGAAELASAYELPASGGRAATVAIVAAHDNPDAEADLAEYRKMFHLPPCTTANHCFRKTNQKGKGALPAPDAGWSQEIALDLDMVSAACPTCRILLVEASSPSMEDLGAAVATAARLGAETISMSWGGAESSSDPSFDAKFFRHPGVLLVASSGDSGYGVEYPAASPFVLAVGGTRLIQSSSSRGWSERAWKGSGSGCSRYSGKPSWQDDSGCSQRTVADVAAVADPNTGVAVYVTYAGAGGWNVFGGTSAAAPLVAGIFARAGKGKAGPGFAYTHRSAFHDVKAGKNGSCPKAASYLCTAHAGYDGPTGWGSPNGASMIAASSAAELEP